MIQLWPSIMPRRTWLGALAWLVPTAALAQPVELCPGATTSVQADGRMFNHLPYRDTDPSLLVAAPDGLSPSGRCFVHPALLADLLRMLADADRDPQVAGMVRTLSCHRSVAYQRATFCAGIGIGLVQRAQSSAPPGFSEHATGYVIDFATAEPDANCPPFEGCFAATRVGRWLIANAPRYGFEMSFPAGARQRVTWEPWHWRWVGTHPLNPSAQVSRSIFATARALYPARPRPAEPAIAIAFASQPPNPRATPTPAPQPKGRKHRQRARN